MAEAPWTAVGRMEQEIRDIDAKLGRKAEQYETRDLADRMRRIEDSVSQLRSLAQELAERQRRQEGEPE